MIDLWGKTMPEAAVRKAYADVHDKEQSVPGETFVAGSIYGGAIFSFKDGKVTTPLSLSLDELKRLAREKDFGAFMKMSGGLSFTMTKPQWRAERKLAPLLRR